MGICYAAQGLSLVFCDDLEGWDGVGLGGRLKREGDVFTYN